MALPTGAQYLNTDSLWHVAETTKKETERRLALQKLNFFYISGDIDSNFIYSKRVKALCDKIDDPWYKAIGILNPAYVNYRIGDFKTVQERIQQATIIAEKSNDGDIISRIQNYRFLIESDPEKKLTYIRQGVEIRNTLKIQDFLTATMLGNLSGAYISNQKFDSALVIAQKMLEMALLIKDTLSPYTMTVMGNAHLNLNQPEIAYAFYKKALTFATASNKVLDLMRVYMPLANYHDKTNQKDSAVFYWKKPFSYGLKEVFSTKLVASKKLYQFYLQMGNNDSALKYMNYYIMANDSLNNANKLGQLQAAKLDFELQQMERQKIVSQEKAERQKNIQLGIIAICIVSALILFFLLSNSILVSHKIVGFLSMVVLLIVFEFINLLIHPFLENITHHNPIWMLLCLVGVAAIIIPIHHRLEHWTTNKLVNKNKAIRLANAHKTLEDLQQENQLK